MKYRKNRHGAEYPGTEMKKTWFILRRAAIVLLTCCFTIPSCAETDRPDPEPPLVETGTGVESVTNSAVTYKITLDPNGGRCDETEFIVWPGDEYPLPVPFPPEEGMIFLGWYEGILINGRISYGKKYTGGVWYPESDLTLTALWFPCDPQKTFSFGRYEQDNDPGNGPEPVLWYVLDWSQGEYLLISADILDSMQLYEDPDPGSDQRYEQSDLRRWLTTDFYPSAFSEEERSILRKKEISAGIYDYVFAPSDHDSKTPTSYPLEQIKPTAVARDHWRPAYTNNIGWWTRDPCEKCGVWIAVGGGAKVSGSGKRNDGVRPAILVDADAFLEYVNNREGQR